MYWVCCDDSSQNNIMTDSDKHHRIDKIYSCHKNLKWIMVTTFDTCINKLIASNFSQIKNWIEMATRAKPFLMWEKVKISIFFYCFEMDHFLSSFWPRFKSSFFRRRALWINLELRLGNNSIGLEKYFGGNWSKVEKKLATTYHDLKMESLSSENMPKRA